MNNPLSQVGAILTARMKQIEGKRLTKREKQLLCPHEGEAELVREGTSTQGRTVRWTRCPNCGKDFLTPVE